MKKGRGYNWLEIKLRKTTYIKEIRAGKESGKEDYRILKCLYITVGGILLECFDLGSSKRETIL